MKVIQNPKYKMKKLRFKKTKNKKIYNCRKRVTKNLNRKLNKTKKNKMKILEIY